MGAFQHKGFALLDIISPCVTFNNHDASTKSYDHIREHNDALGKVDFVPLGREITANYEEGETVEVNLHDGSKMSLEKLDSSYDPTDANLALNTVREKNDEGKVATGLLYIDTKAPDLYETLNAIDKPLNMLNEEELCPGSDKLKTINEGLN